jgi:hypothetical protein
MGRITNKTFKPAGTYWQFPVGLERGFRTANPIPIAEAYVFEIAVEEFKNPLFFSLNTIASNSFDIGQQVDISYRARAIPFLWKQIYINDMKPTTFQQNPRADHA